MIINLTQLKDDLSQNNSLVFLVFFSIYNFHLSFTVLYYLSHAKKLSDFLFLNCFLDYVFSLLFPSVFSNVNRDSQRMEVSLFSVSFCPPKSIIINSFFTASVARQRRHLILVFLLGFKPICK